MCTEIRTVLYGKLDLFSSETPSLMSHCSVFVSGWAATVAFNPKAKAEFSRFRERDDTLSLGVCNGCQLMALLGWVGESKDGGGKRKMAG